MLVIFLETSRNISVSHPKFYDRLNCQNFPTYLSKMSGVFVKIFQNLSRNFLKWFSKFPEQRTSSVITILHYNLPPLAPPISCNGNLRACIENCCTCAATTISIIVDTAAPHQCPHPTTPPSTSVAFFVTLQFSNLVPYVAILKTFHIKNNIL